MDPSYGLLSARALRLRSQRVSQRVSGRSIENAVPSADSTNGFALAILNDGYAAKQSRSVLQASDWLQVGQVVQGYVTRITESCLELDCMRDDGPQQLTVATATCPLSEIPPARGEFVAGDLVNVTVISTGVVPVLSMDETKLDVKCRATPLGHAHSALLRGPMYRLLPPTRIGQLNADIALDRGFRNAHAVDYMLAAYGVRQGSLFNDEPAIDTALVSRMREAQNKQWANETVEKGVALAKKGEYGEAIASYTEALSLDPKNVDAYVAKGAALANQGKLELAIEEFTMALKLDPKHPNAGAYLRATSSKLAAQSIDSKRKDAPLPSLVAAPAAAPLHLTLPAPESDARSRAEKLRRFLDEEAAREERKRRKKDKKAGHADSPDRRR